MNIIKTFILLVFVLQSQLVLSKEVHIETNEDELLWVGKLHSSHLLINDNDNFIMAGVFERFTANIQYHETGKNMDITYPIKLGESTRQLFQVGVVVPAKKIRSKFELKKMEKFWENTTDIRTIPSANDGGWALMLTNPIMLRLLTL